MSATPRMRSGFPATPATIARRPRQAQETPVSKSSSSSVSSAAGASNKSPGLPLAPENAPASQNSASVIPLTVLDAPQQRLYAFAVYTLLWGWKLYDWLQVVEDGDSSWWLFLKWILIDFAYLYGLPELRIPWLELSQALVTSVFGVHLVLNYFLMFNIPLPLQGLLLGFVKILYDRELSISEHNVKVSNILNNHSLIMGKQIINILPEGSAQLNPDFEPFCLGPSSKSRAALPLVFNATVPAEIEFIRIDLDTNKAETIKVPNRDVSRIAKQIREHNTDPNTGFRWNFPVKKPGVYRLGRVLDEYKLEVQRSTKDTYVVPCPEARFQSSSSSERCIRDLSDLSLQVTGTPPLKVNYGRLVNGRDDGGFRFQSLQPEGFTSPLLGGSSAVVYGEADDDASWVRPRTVTIALNESMSNAGDWEYTINEVHDAFGNAVTYKPLGDDLDKPRDPKLTQSFEVKQRPKVKIQGCDLRKPLKVAKGRSGVLPVSYGLVDAKKDTSYKITYDFSPIDTLANSGDHGDEVSTHTYFAKSSAHRPIVSEPGLYTLRSVSSGSCGGEVDEPSSCLLLNPLQPQLSIRSEEIPDKCAGNTVGLRVDLDLVGTPPFTVSYDVITDGHVDEQKHSVKGLRSQIELIPKRAGKHKYVFKSIRDDVYPDLPLSGSDKVLEQVVKPAASAIIATPKSVINACLDSEVELDIWLDGDPPFNLEWEIVHDGKRKTRKAMEIQENEYKINTAPLTKGGEYILALSSVQDRRGCKTFLTDQVKLSVRRQHPRGGFGLVEGRNGLVAVEGTTVKVPLRLQGEAPWTITYSNLNDTRDVLVKKADAPNDNLVVAKSGIYEITGISDKACPGNVDMPASKFTVDWFPRPQIAMVPSESVKLEGDTYWKQDVCEGDIDGFEISLKGAPPYHVQYDVRHKPLSGSASNASKNFDAALGKASITMDTTKAGDYTYQFSGLADNLYDSDRHASPLTIQQRVNAKPSATFSKPGQSFKFCMQEQEHEDKIPISLKGVAPFFVEVEIKHQGGSQPETYRIPSINTKNYAMQIPRQHLRLGSQQVRIRRVRDARGCQQKYEKTGPSIQIHLYDAPSVYPLETRTDFCVGERISYTLSGTPPFDISYNFNGRWNAKSQTTSFRRIAEKPGQFTITSISDKASECRAAIDLPVTIHPLPSVQISQGRNSRVDIHEGNEVDIQFDFWGTPPFEFTYTRSTNAKKGQRSVVLETRHDVSYEARKIVKASQEGTYEVVAIKDKFCSFSTQQVVKKDRR